MGLGGWGRRRAVDSFLFRGIHVTYSSLICRLHDMGLLRRASIVSMAVHTGHEM